MEKTRLFVAIDLPIPIIEQIVALQKRLAVKNFFKGRLTTRENLHVTLKFIGEVDENIHYQVQQALKKITFPALELSIGRLGAFSSEGKNMIIWLGVEGDSLIQLSHAINDVLASVVPRDEREFKSHVTIARIKSVENEELLQFLEQIPLPHPAFTVREFVLKDSVTTPQRAYYRELERYSLV